MSKETGVAPQLGIRTECETELSLCRANPFMLEVYKKVLSAGKTIIITTDMYMPEEFFEELLHKNRFEISAVFISATIGIRISKMPQKQDLKRFIIQTSIIMPRTIDRTICHTSSSLFTPVL